MINRILEIFKPAEAFLQAVTNEINSATEKIETSKLKELLQYGLGQKGQMIRPSLIYFIAKAMDPDFDYKTKPSLIYLAGAVELLHTASLVHDDIIDQSEARRGKESIYKRFGIGEAILTGNTYYLIAFDLANKNLEKSQVESIIKAASDMCCGEVIQQEYKGKVLPHGIYFDIIKKKTSSIIKYACKESAGITSSSVKDIQKMQELGEYLGILYQLSDDYKDGDVLLELKFDYKFYAKTYINKCQIIIKTLDNSIYKQTFEDFLGFLSYTFEF